MYVVAAQRAAYVSDGFQQQIQSLLFPDHADVTDEVPLTAPQFFPRRHNSYACEISTTADHKYPPRRHASAVDRDTPVRLIRRDTDVSGGKGAFLEPT